ncbi:MAG: GNAT family N-acyltransferase [Defluviicoccus sp.]
MLIRRRKAAANRRKMVSMLASSRALAGLRLLRHPKRARVLLARSRRRRNRQRAPGKRLRLKSLWRLALPLLRAFFPRPDAALAGAPAVIRTGAPMEPLRFNAFEVRLAESEAEVEAAQRLRYRVFYDEMQARPTRQVKALGRDVDPYDAYCDHLLVLDRQKMNGNAPAAVVGTYRLLRRSVAVRHHGFYSAAEYDLRPLMRLPGEIVELGRSCVEAKYRSGGVLHVLWRGLMAYVHVHNVNLMFGCASFHGTDPRVFARSLSYLYHYHLAPPSLRPRALPLQYVRMDTIPRGGIDVQAAMSELPPLIKGYLRAGSFVGDGAVIDRQFNTVDVCVIVKTDLITAKYDRRYRKPAPEPTGS